MILDGEFRFVPQVCRAIDMFPLGNTMLIGSGRLGTGDNIRINATPKKGEKSEPFDPNHYYSLQVGDNLIVDGVNGQNFQLLAPDGRVLIDNYVVAEQPILVRKDIGRKQAIEFKLKYREP